MLKNSENRWGLVAQFFHWFIFLIFVNQFVSAEIMMDMANTDTFAGYGKWDLYGWHKAIGFLAIFFVFARLSWRMMSVTPKNVADNSPLENAMARTAHVLLYVLMLAFPISGYVMSMAGGHDISIFGLFNVPNLIGENKALGGIAHEIHHSAAVVTYVVVALHVAAALRHHFVKKNDTLRRMLPWG